MPYDILLIDRNELITVSSLREANVKMSKMLTDYEKRFEAAIWRIIELDRIVERQQALIDELEQELGSR